MNRIVTLDGLTLTSRDVYDVAFGLASVEIAQQSMMKVQLARDVVC